MLLRATMVIMCGSEVWAASLPQTFKWLLQRFPAAKLQVAHVIET